MDTELVVAQSELMEVNYFYETNKEEVKAMMEVKDKYLTQSRYQRQNSVIFYRFLEHLTANLPRKRMIFNVKKGKVYS